jgi:hypothetical protein
MQTACPTACADVEFTTGAASCAERGDSSSSSEEAGASFSVGAFQELSSALGTQGLVLKALVLDHCRLDHAAATELCKGIARSAALPR